MDLMAQLRIRKMKAASENTRRSCFQQTTCCIVLISASQGKHTKLKNGRGESPLVGHDNSTVKRAPSERSSGWLRGCNRVVRGSRVLSGR